MGPVSSIKTLGADMHEQMEITLPDRYDVLERKATGQLSQIIAPVSPALEHIDRLATEIQASSRGAFLILRGDSGTGKSTFVHTIGLFREGIETVSVPADVDITKHLANLPATKAALRIVIFEGREALTDVSKELLEKAVHGINAFVRTTEGERTIVAWPVNRDDLADALSELALALGGESLVGLDDPVYNFCGPDQSEFLRIANNTIALLNQGEGIHDLGISTERAQELLAESPTIGIFLAKIRRDLLANRRHIYALAKKELCRVWIVVLAANEPDSDIDGITRGTMYSADIDRMLAVTNANIVAELKRFPERLGLLGTYFDARVLHVPVLAALAAVRSYAKEPLRKMMADVGMSVTPDKEAKERVLDCNLCFSFKDQPIGARKVGGKVGPNSVAAFESSLGLHQPTTAY